MLHDAAQAIAVGNHYDAVHLLELREDGALPVGHHTVDGVLQALCLREIVLRNECVARVGQCASDAVGGQLVGSHVEAAAPQQHLLVAILGGSLSLVQTLEHTVVLLVQAPALLHGNPVLVHYVEHVVQRLHGTLQIGSICDIKVKTIFLEQSSGGESLLLALLSQVYVGPTGKAVLHVPLALAVAYQYNSFHMSLLLKNITSNTFAKVRKNSHLSALLRLEKATVLCLLRFFKVFAPFYFTMR
ncbi:hypothetical protein EVA_09236 [gut metagenome]|uniref:Uncharacterized protein n=1 Tax=gut metagenome TaxID=749906 RepID=J9G619_9ZZZZ